MGHHPVAGILTRCPPPTAAPPADEVRRVEDTVEFSTYLEREARTRTDPTYADSIAAQARRMREFRTQMAKDLPLFGAQGSPTPADSCPRCGKPPYAGATIGGGGVLATIGPAAAPPAREIWLVTDLNVMGKLIDTLL